MKPFSISILLCLGLLPAIASSAQDLAFSNQKAETTAVRTAWSKAEDEVNGSITKDKLTKMKEIAGTLVNFLQDSCLSGGVYSPIWHGEYNSDKNSPGAQLKFGVT